MGFERCHPAVNLVYFAAVIGGTVCFRHPMYLAVSLICAFLYSVKRNGLPRGGPGSLHGAAYGGHGAVLQQLPSLWGDQPSAEFHWQSDYAGITGVWTDFGGDSGWGGAVDELRVCGLFHRQGDLSFGTGQSQARPLPVADAAAGPGDGSPGQEAPCGAARDWQGTAPGAYAAQMEKRPADALHAGYLDGGDFGCRLRLHEKPGQRPEGAYRFFHLPL